MDSKSIGVAMGTKARNRARIVVKNNKQYAEANTLNGIRISIKVK